MKRQNRRGYKKPAAVLTCFAFIRNKYLIQQNQPINFILISPLLQSAENDFSPPSFDSGRLHSPFFIRQAMEKSSMPPTIVPLMPPFLETRLTASPTPSISHTISPPFAVRLTSFANDNPLTVPFYESCGFKRSHAVKNFFTDNYERPIYECGVRLVDMVYFVKNLE